MGNQGLAGYTGAVYIHLGVITNKSAGTSDWKYVHSTWGVPDPAYLCDKLNDGNWSFSIKGGLRSFFGITDTSEHIIKICSLFRNTDGTLKAANRDGTDMYLLVYQDALQVRIDYPVWDPTYIPTYSITNLHPGDSINVVGYASRKANMTLSLNGTTVKTIFDSIIEQKIPITDLGAQHITLKASLGDQNTSQQLKFSTIGLTDTLDLPPGVSQGINYDSTDPTKATLVLYAPQKKYIYVIGDFNNWTKGQEAYQMHITPDGQYFWCTIQHLENAKQYAYQYIIDDSLIVADYNAHLILDKTNDPYIDKAIYPDLPTFPVKATGELVSVLQTGQPAYKWKTLNFSRPKASDLRIYELLVRDFTKAHNWQSLTDSLQYLQNLGINAIELMPFNEFEGNSSWGYNPDFYFAPDKYYGPATSLKVFIDSCHAKGIAVIMDMVLNHSFGQSPMVQMYFDARKNRPANNNPWFNPVAKHAYNVGYDLNHESEATNLFTKRVMTYWLTQYKIDGFRFDLAKGYTQKQTCDENGEGCDVNAWSDYDDSRVAIWDKYYATQQKISPGSYTILEFLGNNQEEKHYSDEGMLLWENGNSNFNQVTMGYPDGSDLSSFIYSNRGWKNNNMIVYMESHDEQRLMYKNLQYGNSSGAYQINDTITALNRNAMATVLWAALPGPKMLWQFGELGYDYSINYCMDGSGNDDCKTGPKPIGWSYLQNPARVNLSQVYQQMFLLRQTYPMVFNKGTINPNSVLKQTDTNLKTLLLKNDSIDIAVIINFGVSNTSVSISLPDTGYWLPFILNAENKIAFVNKNKAFILQHMDTTFSLPAGAFRVFIHPKRKLDPASWLTNITIMPQSTKNIIRWTSPRSDDSTQFIIEKTSSGDEYIPLGRVRGSISNHEYLYTDNNPSTSSTGSINYRIVVINRHGITQGTGNTQINPTRTSKRMSVYPNPSANIFHISIIDNKTEVPYTIYNQIGKTVSKGSLSSTGGDINLSQLNTGIYFMKVKIENKAYLTKLLKK